MQKKLGHHVTKIARVNPVASRLVILAIDVGGNTEKIQRVCILGKFVQLLACIGADKPVSVQHCGIAARER